MQPKRNGLAKWTAVLFVALLVNTAYITAFASPTVFYMGNVLVHLVLGLALAVAFGVLLARRPDLRPGIVPAAVLLGIALIAGLWLTVAGNVLAHRPILWAHAIAAGLGVIALGVWLWRRSAAPVGERTGWTRLRQAYVVAAVLLVAFPAVMALWRKAHPDPNAHIVNPLVVPTSMEGEGGGPKSPFFPSSAKTNVGGIIPSNFFMDSKTCGECHKDIYQQWNSSAHHFASFNNQFYRKSIEYMQSVVGTQPSKWCAGCHDHAVFFNGRFERPIKDQIDTPEARAGLACTSCHAITNIHSSMGNGDFTIEYPPLHELANSKNPVIHTMDHFLTYLQPEPHRRTFMKPFMRSSAEFCSACHKVHLDVPVNSYRWARGFNDYDNWQASGISGQGARSFYYPAESKVCADCHMPLVESQDPGNHNGKVHSHRFPAANMAVAYANQDKAQMDVVEKFLKSGFITTDIFAVSPEEEGKGETAMVRRTAPKTDSAPQANTTFAVGEEAEQAGTAVIRDVGQIAAPIDKAAPTIKPGSTVRVDVVVRTRSIGHFFPGGTVDAFDVWLELQGRDANGKVVYWSGMVQDDGKGPVEPGAHFYKSYALDGDGNPIDKRNAWQARSVLYVRLIPPGAADVAHYRIRIPADAVGPITLTAKLNYRKFAHVYTQFAYAGQPKPGQEHLITASTNSAEWSYDPKNVPANVSGNIKGEIPNLPIVTLATAEAKLPLGGNGAPQWRQVADKKDRERWNDYGIGLLLQGDLKGAEFAFKKATEAEPGYADGWLNVARALIREGEVEAARPYVEKAIAITPGLPRGYFFKAMIQKAQGDYDGALASLRTVEAKFPRDRVVLNQMARILFLQRKYKESLAVLDRVCLIDPEDVQMHYTAMVSARALGDTGRADREQKLFQRFKADEASQAITAKRRLLSPEDNNERQPIHEHESVPLRSIPKTAESSVIAGG
ncbi:MAG TPA: tetratricopeptide repeat protein [Thermoanaerobaculia bacterium]